MCLDQCAVPMASFWQCSSMLIGLAMGATNSILTWERTHYAQDELLRWCCTLTVHVSVKLVLVLLDMHLGKSVHFPYCRVWTWLVLIFTVSGADRHQGAPSRLRVHVGVAC